MSDGASLDTSDLSELIGLLDAAPLELSRQMGPAVERTGQAIATEAAANAPRDTGELAASIRVRRARRRRDDASIWVGSDLRQALFQELGTSSHPPQPSIAPAAARGLDTLNDELGALSFPW